MGSPVARSTMSATTRRACVSVNVFCRACRAVRSQSIQTDHALCRLVCFVDFLRRWPSPDVKQPTQYGELRRFQTDAILLRGISFQMRTIVRTLYGVNNI